jgi:hypothetical protein
MGDIAAKAPAEGQKRRTEDGAKGNDAHAMNRRADQARHGAISFGQAEAA